MAGTVDGSTYLGIDVRSGLTIGGVRGSDFQGFDLYAVRGLDRICLISHGGHGRSGAPAKSYRTGASRLLCLDTFTCRPETASKVDGAEEEFPDQFRRRRKTAR